MSRTPTNNSQRQRIFTDDPAEGSILGGRDAFDFAGISYGAIATATFLSKTNEVTPAVIESTADLSLTSSDLSGESPLAAVSSAPVNTWNQLKIGAGGWLTGIDIAPDNTMVVRTDTYGAYLWNGNEWQQLVTSTSMPAADVGTGNADGVYEIRIAPSNTNILYMEYLGNVYRSDNRGTTWTKTAFTHVVESANDPYRMNGQKMAIDPSNPDVVYVGTPRDGLFVTQDGGASWQKVSALPVSAQDASGQFPGITGITFDPSSGMTGGRTNTLYASSYGHGVYKSTNGGISWSALSGGPSDVQNAAISSTGVYYAVGNNDTSLWRYTNGAWTRLNPENSNGIHTVSIDPFNASHIIIATPGGNLNQSFDGGNTWSGVNWTPQFNATDIPWLATTGNYMSVGGMVFDQLVANKLWSSAGVGVWNTSVPQNLTWATPVVWNSQSAGIEQLVANEILVAPGGQPVLASWDRPFFYVTDPASYPSTYGVGNPSAFSMGWSLDYASSNPSYLVGINDWWGVEQSGYSSDGGQTWHTFATMPSFAGTTIGGTIAASSPTEIVWAPANGKAPEYTKDGGKTWHPVVLPGVTDWSSFHFAYYLDKQTVTADRVLPDTFYLYYVSGSSSGVFKSTDGGATWNKVFNGQISNWSYYNSRIEAVPGQAGHLFFTGGPQGAPGAPDPADQGFYQSTDGGATWRAVSNVLEVQTFGFGASASPGGYPAIYIVGWVNNVYGIWQSDDDAQSWTKIGDYPTDSLDSIKTIAGDPDIYGQVYVGFGGSGYAYLSGGDAPTPSDNHAPIVTAWDKSLTRNQIVAASTLFSAGDPDGQAITTYALKNVTGYGRFVVNGVVQATNVEITLTAAQLAQTTYVAGSGSDQISVRASDGMLWSAWQSFTLTAPLNRAPVITASNTTLASKETRAASSLFTARDPDGDAITTYTLKNTGNGRIFVNGVLQQSNVELTLTAAQLTQTTYQSTYGTDQISARASDGALWSGWQAFTVSAPLNQAPVVTASTVSMSRNQTIAAASLFTVRDPDGDTITTYALRDMSGNGTFKVNNVIQASNTDIILSAAQLAQTTYRAGSGSEQFSIRAFDGTSWSAWQTGSITIAPTGKGPSKATSTLQSANIFSSDQKTADVLSIEASSFLVEEPSNYSGTVAATDFKQLMETKSALAWGTPNDAVSDNALLRNYMASMFATSSHGGNYLFDPISPPNTFLAQPKHG